MFTRISDIIIYPVKSLGGIHLQEALAEQEGLQYDRRWMLVDVQNRFITQREQHDLCLFRLEKTAQGFHITHTSFPGEQCFLPFESEPGEELSVLVWEDEVKARTVSKYIDQWFSDLLGSSCRLVQHTVHTQRNVDPRYALNNEQTGFSDGFPILLIGEASLQDLNARLAEPVPMNRFRPNLVVSGAEAFAEDHWKNIKTGTAALRIAKPCARCVVTTINQETATAAKEPLRTLATYRNFNSKILFGQNTLVTEPGIIRLGDVLERC